MKTIILLCFTCVLCSENDIVRSTEYGDIRGKISYRLPGTAVEEFLGVPYAAPPVGNLRFKRPRSPTPWKPDILSTTSFPPACKQKHMSYIEYYHRVGFNISSEDCLYLNIYVPKTRSMHMSVMLFIHGGGNIAGMGAMFDGDILAAHGQIIVVTFNYRLDILGFYGNREKGIEGNNGLLDQVKAMEWVHNNIKYFNGDPSQITIYGHSAGSADVGLHLVSDLTKGLFKNAVLHSGSPYAHWLLSRCISGYNSTKALDCKPRTTLSTTNLTYKELMKMSASDVLDQVDHEVSCIADKLYLFGADHIEKVESVQLASTIPLVNDDLYLKTNTDNLFSCNNINAESVLLMTARDEVFPHYEDFTLMECNKSFDEEMINFVHQIESYLSFNIPDDHFRRFLKELLAQNQTGYRSMNPYLFKTTLVADIVFFTPMIKLADMISKRTRQIYLLSFEYVSEILTGPQWQGVPHGWDLFYTFGVPLVGHFVHNYTERDINVSMTTMTLISNFVKYGYLGYNDSKLQQIYNKTMKNYSKLDFHSGHTRVKVENNFRKPRIDFWYKYMFPDKDITCSRGICHSFSMLLIINCFMMFQYYS